MAPQTTRRKLFKLLKWAMLTVFILAALLFAALLYLSPGKTAAIKGAASIAVIESPAIGGVRQGLIIRGHDTANPVLLFLHGGPGMPSFAWQHGGFAGIEKLFTVCYWEQRGAGMSYSKNLDPSTVSLPRLIADAGEVTRYLLAKFHKQKIYIMGHSWGTFLGAWVVHEYPQYYHAYLGVGQLGNTYAAEQATHEFVLAEARRRNDAKALRIMAKQALPAITASTAVWWDYYGVQRPLVFKYGGAVYGRSVSLNERRSALIFCREYTLWQKLRYPKGLSMSFHRLEPFLFRYDLNTAIPVQQVPVYIFQGLHDHQSDYGAAKAYFDRLQAPVKRFYTFARSAHTPHIEEYDEFERIVRMEVLAAHSD